MHHLTRLTLLFCCCTQALFAQPTVERDPVTSLKGLVNPNTGEPVLPFDYEDVFPILGDSIYTVKKGGKLGAVDKTNHLIVPVEYQILMFYKGGQEQPLLFAIAALDNRQKNNKGLVNRKGERVLPMQYEMVSVVYPDLLVAQVYRDSVLHFFDGKGKPLFDKIGRNAVPGFDEQSVKIKRDRGGAYHIKKNGESYFNGRFPTLSWTDGSLVVHGENGAVGMADLQGKVVFPFEYREIQAFGDGNFKLSNAAGEEGLANSKGEWLVPLAKQRIQKWQQRKDAVYTVAPKGKNEMSILDAKGKLLVQDCRTYPGHANQWNLETDAHNWNVIRVSIENGNKMALFSANGKQLLPFEFRDISYYTQKHPLLARRYLDDDSQKSRMEAYDQDGRRLLKAEYKNLLFTGNPKVLIGQLAENNQWGFINLAFPEDAEYPYKQINTLGSGYFAVQTELGWKLLDPKFREQKTKQFDNIITATRPYHEQFRNRKLPGRLVAHGFRTGSKESFGINDLGQAFAFEPLPDQRTMMDGGAVGRGEEAVEAVAMPEEPMRVVEAPSPKVYESVEKNPQFPGGEAALLEFLKKNLKYPAIARENKVAGRVHISFIVDEFGYLEDPRLIRDIGGGCGKEAMRLVGLMPKWIPGEINRKRVRTRFTLPVDFKLD